MTPLFGLERLSHRRETRRTETHDGDTNGKEARRSVLAPFLSSRWTENGEEEQNGQRQQGPSGNAPHHESERTDHHDTVPAQGVGPRDVFGEVRPPSVVNVQCERTTRNGRQGLEHALPHRGYRCPISASPT